MQRTTELSSAELKVAALLATGAGNNEIAEALQLQLPSVKAHVHCILQKLGVNNRTQAALKLSREPPPQLFQATADPLNRMFGVER